MKNKKKLLVLALALVLLIAVAVSATLAYFTDTEGATNTMTSGNIYITQHENDRDGVELDDNADGLVTLGDIIPAVHHKNGLDVDAGAVTLLSGNTMSIWDSKINNEIDKFVSIENTADRDAYVRTIFLFENEVYTETRGTASTTDDETTTLLDKINILDSNSDGQHLVWLTEDDGAGNQIKSIFEIGSRKYSIAVATYNTALQPGKITDPSLCQIHLDPTAGNDWSETANGADPGDGYTIIAFSQAVQTTGFDASMGYTGSADALNEAFGEVTELNVEGWLALLEIAA